MYALYPYTWIYSEAGASYSIKLIAFVKTFFLRVHRLHQMSQEISDTKYFEIFLFRRRSKFISSYLAEDLIYLEPASLWGRTES